MGKDLLNENKYFLTHDLGLASALFTAGFNIEGLEKIDRVKVVFVFNKSQELNSHIENYWNGNLSVDALQLYTNIRVLKNRIFSNMGERYVA